MFCSFDSRQLLSVIIAGAMALSASPLMAQTEQVYAPAQMAGGRFGLGFVFGEPTGVNAKLWQTQELAIDAGIAWSVVEDAATTIYGDLLWHQFDLLEVTNGSLPVYLGAGARFQFADETHFGIRTVVGLDYILARAPFDVFLELVPTFDLAPEADFVFNAAVGFRYFFR